MGAMVKRFLVGIVDAEQEAAVAELRARIGTLRAEVLERLRNLDSTEENLPVNTADRVSDSVLRISRNLQEARGGCTREAALDDVLAELGKEFAS